jgi:hypothetical protein
MQTACSNFTDWPHCCHCVVKGGFEVSINNCWTNIHTKFRSLWHCISEYNLRSSLMVIVEKVGTFLLSFRSCSVHAHCKRDAVEVRDRITAGRCVSFNYVAFVGAVQKQPVFFHWLVSRAFSANMFDERRLISLLGNNPPVPGGARSKA